ncbi:IucA/IucC family C-terminal-domain containing protein [Planosporangium sp. 12N6]|uniref:IucA/IucC family C-terminal-domain containing protein n=1 Tax=Planosporangium spinosum TaxID=3402278 RepID=UPI003CECBD06
MTGRYPVHGLAPGLYVTDTTGWTPATEIVHGAAFDDLLDAAQRRWDATPHVAAALAWKYYSYWTALPALLGYATARRVPLLEPDKVLVRYADRQPFLRAGLTDPGLAVLPTDPLAALDQPGIRVVRDEPALLDALRSSLIDAHLAPVVDRLHARTRLGTRTLWGSLASGVAHAISRAADVVPGSTLEVVNALLTGLDLNGLVDLTPGPAGRLQVRRRTCCLAFTLPEARICTGCVITTP